MNSNQQQLWDRLNAFCQKIAARHGDIMAEAESGCRDLVAANPQDPRPCLNALDAIDHRVGQLMTKLHDTWSGGVDDKFIEANVEGDPISFDELGLERVEAQELELNETWQRLKVGMAGYAYRAVWPHAQQAMSKPTMCSQCGAALKLPQRHQAVTHTCTHCDAVNQVVPEAPVQTYFSGAPHSFAEEASLEQRLTIERFRHEVDVNSRRQGYPKESIESLDRWEAMEGEYWRIYTTARAQITRESQQSQQEFIKSRTDYFRQYTLMTEQHWRRAKGL